MHKKFVFFLFVSMPKQNEHRPKRNASRKKDELLCCKCFFEYGGANLAANSE